MLERRLGVVVPIEFPTGHALDNASDLEKTTVRQRRPYGRVSRLSNHDCVTATSPSCQKPSARNQIRLVIPSPLGVRLAAKLLRQLCVDVGMEVSMKTLLRLLVLCFVLPAVTVLAQNKVQDKAALATPPSPENPLSTWNKLAYARVKGVLLKSAEKMPEENYGFKPVDTVRSYGQIVGHVADAQYIFCSLALGEKNPAPDIEHTKTSKADLISALNTAFAYCDRAYDGMTDTSAVQTIKLFGNDAPRLSALTVNNMHDLEHYGNLATYMRMKNIVPPSSEQPPPPQPPKK
jgi:uncharacterized damage-inducible protein DinB